MQAAGTDMQLKENGVEDLMTEATTYSVRAVNNRRRRGRRNNHHRQFLGPVRNMFGGGHRHRVPYKRLPAAPASRFRVGVHTPDEVRSYP